MKMKKLVSVVLATTMMMGVVGCSSSTSDSADKLEQIKEAGKIVLGTSPDFPPSEFYILDENGEKQIVGSDISLAQAIADEIGVELEIKATDFNGVLANVQSGTVDMAISGFAQTEERKKVMQFSDGYQRDDSEDYQGILTTKEIAEKYKTLDEFKDANLTIAAQAGSIQYEMALKLTDESNIKQYGTIDAAALALDAGDIDAVIISSNSGEPMLDTFTDMTILPKNGFDLDPDAMYSTNVIGFPLGDEYQSLIDLCNEVIAEARENGDLENWVTEAKELSAQAIEVEE
ncbi:transporter substrate-binding domain-containing protein [Faecalitalea cylindroides]|uniref:transporter substrate-binding domain-containing protein n=1 Tax=Faecalitalea cylindroides TaxID=39483 RepID=UPI0022E1D895|nr:transporter substrate-binding domain-containing protein [Faecalitalea cylindroides]